MSTLSVEKQVSAKTSVINNYTKGRIDSKANISKKEKAALTLFDDGKIRDCNQVAGNLLGCSPSELTGQHITRLFPQLAEIKLVQGKQANSYLRFLSRIGHPFEVVDMKGMHLKYELFFNDVENLGQHHLRIIICPAR